jgi:alkylation response protein AidB-like acyl-CoA dehydrogenase
MVDGAPEVVAVILRINEAEIIDTWQTLGMRGTDSNDVAVTNVFVPASRTFRLVPEFTPGKHYGGPLYRFPGIAEAAVIVAPVLLAIARGAIDEFLQLARGKTPFGSTKLLRDRPIVQTTVARAEGLYRSARALFHGTLEQGWQQAVAGQPFTLEQKADLLLAGVHATHSAWNVVDLMHPLAGTSAIYREAGSNDICGTRSHCGTTASSPRANMRRSVKCTWACRSNSASLRSDRTVRYSPSSPERNSCVVRT